MVSCVHITECHLRGSSKDDEKLGDVIIAYTYLNFISLVFMMIPVECYLLRNTNTNLLNRVR